MNRYTVTYGLIPPQDQLSQETHILPITKIFQPKNHSRYLLTCGRDGTIIKHAKKRGVYERYRMQINSDWVTDLLEVADGKYIVVSQDFSICLLIIHEDNDTWESKIIGYHDDYVKCVGSLKPSDEGNIRFVTCGLDMKLKIWSLVDDTTSLLMQTFDNVQTNDTGSLYAMATINDNSLPFDIIAGDNNGNILFICSDTGEKVGMIPNAHNTNIKTLQLMDGSQNLTSSSADGMIKLWKLSDVLEKGINSLIHSWKWSCSVWCIEGNSSEAFYMGDSRGVITKVGINWNDWTKPFLSTVFKPEKKGDGGILSILLYEGREVWFSRSGNSNLTVIELDTGSLETIYGGFALLKCSLLTNRRHVITQNTRGEVQRWDIVSCELLDTFDPSMGEFDDLVRKYNTKEILPHWCSVSIKTGKLFIKLSKKFLSTEIYGSALQQYTLVNKVDLGDDERYNLGRIVINSILNEFITYELEKDKQFRKDLVAKKSSAPGTPTLMYQNQIPADSYPSDAARPSIKEKRRLSLFTKFTSSSVSSSQQMTPTSLPNTPVLEKSNPLATDDHSLLPPPATAPPVENSQRESFDPLPPSAMKSEGRSASSGSLLTRKLRMFSSNNNNTNDSSLSDENESDSENAPVQQEEAPEPSHENMENIKFNFSSKSFNGTIGTTQNAGGQLKSMGNEIVPNTSYKKHGFMLDFMEELREEYTKHNVPNSSSLRILSKKIPESKITRDNDSPIIELKTGVLLLVNCWKEGSCGDTVCFSTYLPAPEYDNGPSHEHHKKHQMFESLEKNFPYWVAEALFKDEKVVKEYPKLCFIIKPWEDLGVPLIESNQEQGPLQHHNHHHHLPFYKTKTNDQLPQSLPHIAEANTKLNAPSMIKVKKIMRYVVDRFETRTPEMKNRTDVSEWLEILCKGQVLDTDVTLSTVRTLFWKSQGDIVLEYRRKILPPEEKK